MQTEQKKKILYIMGIDWGWIYQRPQIIAEYLCRDFDVTVAYPVKVWDRNAGKGSRKEDAIRHLRLWTFPLQRKSRLVGEVSDKYIGRLLRTCYQYEYVYIDYPTYINYIPEDYKGYIIYDCIDDYGQMCINEYGCRKVEYAERLLLQRSYAVLASSQRLVKKLAGQTTKGITLVRNGTGFDEIHEIKAAEVKEQYHVGYIGTIAEWFDIGMILQSAADHPGLAYHLVGPCMGFAKKEGERVSYEGIVEHSRLYAFIQEYDCLVMPFVVNEIVKAVDPVKLYEYIAFGKCVVSIYYEELEHFRDFVYFYKTREEYDSLMEDLMHRGFPPRYNSRQQRRFLLENSWEERYKRIREAIGQTGDNYREAEG